MEFRIFRLLLFSALWKLSEGMTEQNVLDSLAEKVSAATGRKCTAPTMPQTDGSESGTNCGTRKDINVKNGHITNLFDLNFCSLSVNTFRVLRDNSLAEFPTELYSLTNLYYLFYF